MRGVEYLIPKAQVECNKFISACESKGLKVKITDTLRTKQEQDALYAQGRTKAGSIVTNVKYPNSMHNWGVAWDFCRADGRDAYDNSDRFFEKCGEVAVSLGLIWGGNWKSIIDRPHVQLSDWGDTPTQLKNEYGDPDTFKKYFKDLGNDDKLTTLREGCEGFQVFILQGFLFKSDIKEIDGIFGKRTLEKVTKFQKENGLEVDGIVGRITWNTLLSVNMR